MGLGDQDLGFPKVRGTSLGVPMMRIIVFSGLFWSPPNFIGRKDISLKLLKRGHAAVFGDYIIGGMLGV